ncbi:Ig-like domain-containing protein [Acanthopleuribacter pedis]|uniref:Ig-like domain-containing protein n=1 Tax=Acanthopleuribacter pedis TaxID=442870 RepID=A0A8J7QEY9_9BACT|nr:Ig-like domain-containing protein [Acanthopleuribacter pedis]MBO1322774.1 Ig-like domain-containing protein [Acanthopleuribacter pedis]
MIHQITFRFINMAFTLFIMTTSAWSQTYYYLIEEAETGRVVQRGETDARGIPAGNLILAPQTRYREWLLDGATLFVGVLAFETPEPGRGFTIPAVTLRRPATFDSDGDGLHDEAEFILGSNGALADTDNDGLDDGFEFEQGSDLLDGLIARTGIIAAVPTADIARDLCAFNNRVAVAESAAGISLYNVFNGMAPLLIGRIDTPGSAEHLHGAGNRLAVADGSGGLVVIDVADPPNLAVRFQVSTVQLGARVNAVQIGPEHIYAGLADGRVLGFDPDDGSLRETLTTGDTRIDAMAQSGGLLFVLTNSDLRLYDPGRDHTELGNLAITGSAVPQAPGRTLGVGRDLALVGTFTGFKTIDIRQPTNPQLIGEPSGTQAAAHAFGLTGSDTLLVVTSFGGTTTLALSLYDLSQPSDVTNLITSFTTPGQVRGLSVYNGLAYLADGTGGLRVVNFLGSDTLSQPPAISLNLTGRADNRVEGGRPFLVTAEVNDDIQVREVVFSLDGTEVPSDGSFPFEQRFLAPAQHGATLTVRARAFDTGGNNRRSEPLTLSVVDDATAPTRLSVSPAPNRILAEDFIDQVGITFDEPLEPSSLTPGVLLLREAGPDETFDTADDHRFPEGVVQVVGATVTLSFPTSLPAGRYRADLAATLTDAANNPVDAFQWLFELVTRIEIGTVVDGAIQTPGELDRFAFVAAPGQRVFFDRQISGNLGTVDWACLTPSGETLFRQSLGSADPGSYSLLEPGIYLITLGEPGTNNTDSYRFQLWDVSEPDRFAITIGDTVSDGIPGPGAGRIETPGSLDQYRFQATAGQQIFLDVQRNGQLSSVDWQLENPAGVALFSNCLGCGDPGTFRLAETGEYTIQVGGDREDDVGDYRFRLTEVPPANLFDINLGDTVSDGSPGPGAGNIETPGAFDGYRFSVAAGTRVFFDVQRSNDISNIDWRLEDETGANLFETCFGCGDPGTHLLERGGTYTLWVGEANNDRTGVYQFRITEVPPAQHFQIAVGDSVSEGVPAAGAGLIETPGAFDLYRFEGSAGQTVFFDVQDDRELGILDWRLYAPDDRLVFNECFGCGDPGNFTLSQTGTYQLEVGEHTNDQTGAYRFRVTEVPAPQRFTLNIGDTVSDGTPAAGAGNIETPGAFDIYQFAGTAGQNVFFDVQDSTQIRILEWRLFAPDDSLLFSECFACGDPGSINLPATGTYQIVVGEDDDDTTGTYRFAVTEVPAAQEFDIALGDRIGPDDPMIGAGRIEVPGAMDVYIFTAAAGQTVSFDSLTQDGVRTLDWRCMDEGGTVVFDTCLACSDPGSRLLSRGGTYTIIVGETDNDAVGTYSFSLSAAAGTP